MKIAVLVPFYRGQKYIPNILSDLQAQTYDNFRVYFVDDGSGDGTAEALKKACPDSLGEVLALSENLGPPGARNVGIRKALEDGAEAILLLDSDGRVGPEWVSQHTSFLKERPDVAILGGSIRGKSDKIIGLADGFCSWFTAPPHSPAGEMKKFHLSTTNMSIRASVFEKVGFFDEELKTGEDVAFCRRVRGAGLTLWLQPEIEMIHLDRTDRKSAAMHHYRWGLHSYQLCLMAQGGYYMVLKKIPRFLVPLTIPAFCFLNVILILSVYGRRYWQVWAYLPWIIYLKWQNSVGVYRGFLDPTLCLRQSRS